MVSSVALLAVIPYSRFTSYTVLFFTVYAGIEHDGYHFQSRLLHGKKIVVINELSE